MQRCLRRIGPRDPSYLLLLLVHGEAVDVADFCLSTHNRILERWYDLRL